MRGVSAVAVILVIVVLGVIGYFALQYLPTGVGPPKVVITYKNDVITVEDLYVSNLKPYERTDTDIEFLVSNNGDQPVENVVVTFESTGGGFELIQEIDLKCAGDKPQKTSVTVSGRPVEEWNKCVFNRVESLDAKAIHLTLHPKGVLTDTTYNIKYSIQYDYKGSRLMTVPIINSETRSRPVSKFSQSTPSVGPVVLDFQAGEAREFTEAGKKVTGYWLEVGRTAEVKLSLKNIGSSSIGTINDTYINTATFTLDTKGTLQRSGFCHFKETDEQTRDPFKYCRNVDQPDPSRCELSAPMRPVKLPAELLCNFKPALQATVPEVSGTISANFDYTYKFAKTQSITVRDVRGT